MKKYKDGEYEVISPGDGTITFPTTNGPKTICPGAVREITDEYTRDMLRKRYKNPDDYFYCGSAVLRKAAQPVVEDALAICAAKKKDRENREKDQENRELVKAQAACPAGHEICTRLWRNGDLCSAEYQAADGTKVFLSDLLPSLDETRFYAIPSVDLEVQRTKDREKQLREAAAKNSAWEERSAKTEQARLTGEPVILSSWMTESCMNRKADCSFDLAQELVLPDGTIKIKYTCCY